MSCTSFFSYNTLGTVNRPYSFCPNNGDGNQIISRQSPSVPYFSIFPATYQGNRFAVASLVDNQRFRDYVLGLKESLDCRGFEVYRKKGQSFVKRFLGQDDARPALDQRIPVGLVSGLGQLLPLFELAVSLAHTSVAYKRRFEQIRTWPWILGPRQDNPQVILDFLGDGRGIFPDTAGDSLEGYAMIQAVLDFDAVFKRQVLVRTGVLL